MLLAYALDFKSAWDEQLALIEFSYDNSCHASIGMTPYKALYGRKCKTPLCRREINEVLTIGPELIQATTDKVKVIQERMKAARRAMPTRGVGHLNSGSAIRYFSGYLQLKKS